MTGTISLLWSMHATHIFCNTNTTMHSKTWILCSKTWILCSKTWILCSKSWILCQNLDLCSKTWICVAKPGFCVAKPGFCVATCDAIPGKLCPVQCGSMSAVRACVRVYLACFYLLTEIFLLLPGMYVCVCVCRQFNASRSSPVVCSAQMKLWS